MRGVKSFLEERLPEMLDYITVVSTPGSEESSQPSSAESHVRNRAIRALNERKQAMSELHRESIPSLPHILDIPRHLAILTSAIARNSRDSSIPQDPVIADLYNRCREVEQHALYRVSRHAARRGVEGSLIHPLSSSDRSLGDYDLVEDPRPRKPSSRTSSSRSRPRTAPSGATSDPSLYSGSHDSQEFHPPREGDSGYAHKRQVSRPRSASIDSTPESRLRDAAPERKPSAVTLAEMLRPQNAERKKGFFRNMLVRK